MSFELGIFELAPVIRGLSFDGEKGLFVRYIAGSFPSGPGVLEISGDQNGMEEKTQKWIS